LRRANEIRFKRENALVFTANTLTRRATSNIGRQITRNNNIFDRADILKEKEDLDTRLATEKAKQRDQGNVIKDLQAQIKSLPKTSAKRSTKDSSANKSASTTAKQHDPRSLSTLSSHDTDDYYPPPPNELFMPAPPPSSFECHYGATSTPPIYYPTIYSPASTNIQSAPSSSYLNNTQFPVYHEPQPYSYHQDPNRLSESIGAGPSHLNVGQHYYDMESNASVPCDEQGWPIYNPTQFH
jgi:hypothetical protein